MANSLLITGASGFIGRHLLSRLPQQLYDRIYCLTRTEKAADRQLADEKKIRWLIGSVFDGNVYGRHLASSSTVIHLAATTGKALRNQYFTVNAAGTRYLLSQCKQRGVKNFLYVSSIAVKYEDKAYYHYAQSKQEGEEAVIQSGLNYTIVRPTIVLGKESQGWSTLSRLARLRLVPLIGNGKTRIQPIDIDDLVDAMIAIIHEHEFRDETFELGGPDILSIEEFLKKIHRLYHGTEPRVLHLPRKPVTWIVACAEKYLSGLMPVNAGQLSVFGQNGTIVSNRLYEKRRSHMKDIDTVLRGLTQ